MRHSTDPTVDQRWRALFESEDERQASVIATCLEAMEYDVELRIHPALTPGSDAASSTIRRHVVHVQADDLAALLEVLDEIILEQEEFDSFVLNWRGRSGRADRRLLIAMTIIVAALAVTGAIKL